MTEVVDAHLRVLDDVDRALWPYGDDPSAKWVENDATARNTNATLVLAGKALTLDGIRRLQHRRPDGDLDPDAIEALNHLRFYQRLGGARPPRSPKDIQDVHAALFGGVLEDAGELRGDADAAADPHGATAPDAGGSVEERLQATLHRLAEADAHPVVAAATITVDLERLRPFRRGNGRVARALNHVLLQTGGHTGIRFASIDEHLAREASRFDAVRAAARTTGDAVAWGRYLAHRFSLAFDEAWRRVGLAERFPRGLRERQWLVADWLAQKEATAPGTAVRFRDVQADFGWVATRTLKRDLALLRDEGVFVMEGRLKAAAYRMAEPYAAAPPT